jgi:glycosyltransferase involved in cell wall biosynthesis
MKASIFNPCIAVGGGDMFACSLVRHSQNIDFRTMFVGNSGGPSRLLRAIEMTGGRVVIHVKAKPNESRLNHHLIRYHDDGGEAVRAAAADVDAVISWHCQQTAVHANSLKSKLIVELVQNEDEHARENGHRSVAYADAFVAVSNAAGVAAYPKNVQFKVIGNGIEADRSVGGVPRDDQRRVWGIEPNEKVCLFSGRLTWSKNPSALIAAISKLPPYFTALIVGEGDQRDQLSDLAVRLAPGRVRFLNWLKQPADVLAASDCFVLTSEVEGDSLAMKEAMTAGLPCVCSRVGSVDELVQKYGEILVASPKNPSADVLAELIVRATSPAFKPNVERARTIALRDFTIRTVATQWEALLTELLYHHRMNSIQSTPIRLAASPLESNY